MHIISSNSMYKIVATYVFKDGLYLVNNNKNIFNTTILNYKTKHHVKVNILGNFWINKK